MEGGVKGGVERGWREGRGLSIQNLSPFLFWMVFRINIDVWLVWMSEIPLLLNISPPLSNLFVLVTVMDRYKSK